MTKQERKKRQQPSRSAPKRSFVSHGQLGAARETGTASHAAGIDDVIADAVSLGYRVVEEQLQQGRRAARSFRNGADSSPETQDIMAVIERLVRVTRDATIAWLDVVTAVTSRKEGKAASVSADTDTKPAAATVGVSPSNGTGGGAISVEVKSKRPAKVTLDLRPASPRFVPMVHALHPKTPGKRPLTDVRFRLSPDDGRGVLVISVPDDLEPGNYTGVVVDSATDEPGGTLCVRVHAED